MKDTEQTKTNQNSTKKKSYGWDIQSQKNNILTTNKERIDATNKINP